jgi:hypothetical protein
MRSTPLSRRSSLFAVRNSQLTALALLVSILLLAACGGGPHAPAPGNSLTSENPTSANGVPHSSHVVLVIEENHTFTEVVSQMPWLTAMGDQYAFANNYFADAPGSALDYFWLSSGSGEQTYGCAGWGCTMPIASSNIFGLMTKAGLTWKVYAESLPSVGWMGGDSGAYVARHNPAKWYADVINSPAMQQNIVGLDHFLADVAANNLPNYSLVIPNVNDDAHDGTLDAADTWLKTNIGATIMNLPAFKAGGDGMLIVTFDECDGAVGACPEQVYTAVIGPNVKRGYQSANLYKHENTLRTMLDALGVATYPGASKTSADMTDFFK